MAISQEKRAHAFKVVEAIHRSLNGTRTGRELLENKTSVPYFVRDDMSELKPGSYRHDPHRDPAGIIDLNSRLLQDDLQKDHDVYFDTLVHERTHALTSETSSIHEVFNQFSPRDVLFLRRMDESNAIARSIQTMWELKEQGGNDRPWRYLEGEGFYFPNLEAESVNPYKESFSAFQKSLKSEMDADKNGAAMKAAFMKRLLKEKKMNAEYNDDYLKKYEDAIVGPKSAFVEYFATLPKNDKKTRLQLLEYAGFMGVVKPRELEAKDIAVHGAWLKKNYLADKDGKLDYLMDPAIRSATLSRKDKARLKRIEHAAYKLQVELGLEKPQERPVDKLKNLFRSVGR